MGPDEQKNMTDNASYYKGFHPFTLRDYVRFLGTAKWRIGSFALGIGVLSLLITFAIPNYYRASAVIKPDTPDKTNPGGVLGALATFGVSLGSSKVEDLEVLFKSRDLAARVFEKYGLWSIVYPDEFDPKSGMMRPGLLERIIYGNSEPRPPGKWEAFWAARDWLKVYSDRRTGTIMISYDARTPEASARIVSYFLEEAKSRLQEEALQNANRSKQFLLDQLQKTVDPITRDRLYSLFSQEVEKEMLARNRDQFGFTLVDAPEPPIRKYKPKRALIGILSLFTAFFAACMYLLVRMPTSSGGTGG